MASAYYTANREACLARAKARYIAKRDEIRAYKKQWHIDNAQQISAKKRAAYAANREIVLAGQRQHYAENADRIKARVRGYRQDNPAKARAAVVAWCLANRERLLAIKREYARARPEIGRAKRARRRAREQAAHIGPVDFAAVLASSGGICGICRKPLGDAIHFDHIVPLSRGGAHAQDNFQAAHPECNLRKGSKLQSEVVSWL